MPTVTVGQLLDKKGAAVWTVPQDETVYYALCIMADRNVGALVVMDGNKMVGVFSERDYARKVVLQGKSSKETSVGDMMTKRVRYTTRDESVANCMALMSEKRIRHLPVLDNNKVKGIISIGDVVNTILQEQQSTIEEMEKYITGSGY
jgi:CBS domain-containing protein